MLKDTGLGALPLNPDPAEPDPSLATGQNVDPRLEILTDQVNAIFKEGKNARERATVVLDVLKARPTQGPAE